MGKKGGSPTVTDYYMAVHFGVCYGPVDAVTRLRIDDKEMWSGEVTTNQAVTVSKLGLFGGAEKEGGVAGRVDIALGSQDDLVNEQLRGLVGADSGRFPAYRGICNLVFRGINSAVQGFLWATNYAAIKPVKMTVRRMPKAFEGNEFYTRIDSNANPSAIILECLTSEEFGLWMPLDQIDVDSFEDAALTLKDEEFGLSFMWVRQEKVEEFINVVGSHINAITFVSSLTGKYKIKLIRGDYNPETLPVLDPSNCKLRSYQRRSWGETINEVVVKWRNPVNEQEETVTVQDISNISMQGSLISTTLDLPGIRSADLAIRVAQRELQANATPLLMVELDAHREFYNLEPGDVFKLSWPRYGIESVILRVTKVNYGTMGNDWIRVEAQEDIFGMPLTTFVDDQGTEWVDPRQPPAPAYRETAFTVPYYLAVQYFGEEQVENSDAPSTITGALVTQTGYDTYAYEFYVRDTDSLGDPIDLELGNRSLAAHSQLNGTLIREVESVFETVNGIQENRFAPGVLLWIGKDAADAGELMLITAIDAAGFHVKRGVLDTVPQQWPLGTEIWALDEVGVAFDDSESGGPIERLPTEVVEYRALTRTSLGELAFTDATPFTTTVNERTYLPYRPADCRVNGILFPADLAETDLTITWKHRNRYVETGPVFSWTDPSTALPENVSYIVQIYNATTSALIHESDPILGESYSYTAIEEALENGGAVATNVRVVLFAVDSEFGESWQRYDVTFTRPPPSGWTFDYGNNFGGV